MKSFDTQITFLRTTDLKRTAQFYEDVLGLDLALDQGTCRIYCVSRNSFIGFCEREEAAGKEGIILTLVTEDVDGWHRVLTQRGVEFENPPRYNPEYDIYHCFFRDPEGYLVEIQRFEDQRWKHLFGSARS